jgi:hypothetical protein
MHIGSHFVHLKSLEPTVNVEDNNLKGFTSTALVALEGVVL